MEIMIMDLEKERKDQLQIIKKFAASLTDKNTVDEIIWDVANNVISKLGFIDCVIYLIETEMYLHFYIRVDKQHKGFCIPFFLFTLTFFIK